LARQGHGWAKAFRLKGFPLFDEIAQLVDGRVATGAGVFRAGAQNDLSSVGDESEPSSQIEEPLTSHSPSTSVEDDGYNVSTLAATEVRVISLKL
jgi:hypothetical protein